MAINWCDITEEVNCSQTEVGSNDLVHEHKVLPGKLEGSIYVNNWFHCHEEFYGERKYSHV